METILESNPRCADCLKPEVHSVSMDFGVAVCELCSIAHQVIGFPIKKVAAAFTPEELAFLRSRGNLAVNEQLLLNLWSWVATPQEYDFDYVRLFYIENKYIHKSFAVQPHYQVIDLDKYWFFLDEVSTSRAQERGPYSREQVNQQLSLLSVASVYVWHPMIGRTWTLAERVSSILSPPASLTEDTVHQACFRTLALQDLPFPHLKGPLEVANGQNLLGLKWVALVGVKLRLFGDRLANHWECDILLTDSEPSLAQRGPDIYMVLVTVQRKWSFFASSAEVLEWFHAIRCVRHLFHNLGESMLLPAIDSSELHICTVKSCPEYIGEKLLEALMKVEIGKLNITSWVVLREKGIYCYEYRLDKVCQAKVPVDASTQIEADNHRLCIVTSQQALTLSTDSQAQQQAWMSAVTALIDDQVHSAQTQQAVRTYKLDWSRRS